MLRLSTADAVKLGHEVKRLDTSTAHCPIMLKWYVKRCKSRAPIIREIRTFKDVDWNEVRRRLTSKLANVQYETNRTWSQEEIDVRIAELTEILNETQDETARWIKVREHESVPMSEEILALMNRRRQAVKEKHKAKKNSNPGWRELMNEVIKETTGEIEKRMRSERQERLEKILCTIDANRNPFQQIKKLTGGGGHEYALKVEGAIVQDEKKVTDEFKKYYEEVYKEVQPECKEMEESWRREMMASQTTY